MDMHQVVLSRYAAAKSARANREDKWRRFWKLYRSDIDKETFPFDCKVFVPVPWSAVETVVPRMQEALFPTGGEPFFLEPRHPTAVGPAKGAQAILALQWERARGWEHYARLIRDMAIYGTGFLKVDWVDERREGDVPIRPRFVGPAVQWRDLINIYTDPHGVSIPESLYVIEREVAERSVVELRIEQGVYRLPRGVDLEEVVTAGSAADWEIAGLLSDRRDAAGDDDSGLIGDPHRERVELLHYWEDDRLVVLANQNVVLFDGPNPLGIWRKPFVAVPYTMMSGSIYGVGVIEPIEDLVHQLNFLTNNRREHMELALNPPLLMRNGLRLNERDWKRGFRAGSRLSADRIDEMWIRFLSVPDTPLSSWQDEQALDRRIEEAVALSEVTRGASPSSRRTATEVAVLDNASSSRFTLAIAQVEQMGLLPMLDMWLDLNRLFLDDPVVVRVAGDAGQEFLEVQPDALWADVDIRASASRAQARQVQNQQFLGAMNAIAQVVAQAPLFQAAGLDVGKIVMMVLERFEVKERETLRLAQPPQAQGIGAGVPEAGLGGDVAGLGGALGQMMSEPAAPEAAIISGAQMMARANGGGV